MKKIILSLSVWMVCTGIASAQIIAPMTREEIEQRVLYGNITGNVFSLRHGEKQPLAEVLIYAIPDALESTFAGDPKGIETDQGWFRVPDLSQVEKYGQSKKDGTFLISGVPTSIHLNPYTIFATAEGMQPVIFQAIPLYPGAIMYLNAEIVFDPTAAVGTMHFVNEPDLPLTRGAKREREVVSLSIPSLRGAAATIYATREGLVGGTTSNGHVIVEHDHFVAFPYVGVLCSRNGYEYQVQLAYNGHTKTEPIWDIGPWNIHDNHFAPEAQRQIYQYLSYGGQSGGLGQGVPEAQAAYYNDFNQGYDEYDRQVPNPAGIDLADGTFWDDLGMSGNDWVQVDYLWISSSDLCGALSGTLEPGNYELTCPIYVNAGQTLHIKPGVTLDYKGFSFTVNGQLTWGP